MKLQSIEIDSSTKISRYTDLIFSRIDDEIVILSVRNEEYYNLNPVGSKIWNFIIEAQSFSNIVNMLMEQYEVPIDECISDTKDYIQELYELGIVIIKNE